MSNTPSTDDWRDPTDPEIAEAADRFIQTGVYPDARVTTCHFVDEASRLPDQKLQFLFTYWNELKSRNGGRFVSKQQIDVLDMRPLMGYLLVLEAERDGFDAIYRVYGTEISRHAGRDWTGHRVSEMNRVARSGLALAYRMTYRAVWLTLRPIYMEQRSPDWLAPKSWLRLIVPACDPWGRCTHFFVGNLPHEIRPLSEEENLRQRQILGTSEESSNSLL